MDQEYRSGVDNPAFVSLDDALAAAKDKPEGGDGGGADGGSTGVATPPRVLTTEEKKEKFTIMKNILIISIAFFFLFTSYNSMSNLQSSINKVDGTASLTALYAAFIFSCCFLPSWLLTKLKEKYTLALSMLCYSLYIAAQFYPENYTLTPTAIVLGLGAAPLWSSKCIYLTKVGTRYGELVGESSDVIITKFFGIFFTFFQSTQVVGNLIASLVLSVGVEDRGEETEESYESCGYNFCIAESSSFSGPDTNSSDPGVREGPPLWQIYTMASIYLACSLLACVVILVFLNPLSKFKGTEDGIISGRSGLQLLVATFNHLRHPYQLLVVPLTLWSGLEQGFLFSDYTAGYVSCGLGVHMVGYILVFYGLCDSICSFGLSALMKVVGRVAVFTVAFVLNLTLMIVFIYWMPHPDDIVWFFVFAGLWGMADAVWQTQINALYGVIFPGESEAAFSNYRLWESLGFLISYAGSTVLCVHTKMTMLFVFLFVGIVGYYVVEVLEKLGGLKKDQEGRVILLDQLFLRSRAA